MNKLSRIGISFVIILLVLLFFVSFVFTNEVSATEVQPAPTYRLEITNLPQADYLFIPFINDYIDIDDHRLYVDYIATMDQESYAVFDNETYLRNTSRCFKMTFECYKKYAVELNIDYMSFVEYKLRYLNGESIVGFNPEVMQYYHNATEIQWECDYDLYIKGEGVIIKPYLYDITHDILYDFNTIEHNIEDSNTTYTLDYSKHTSTFSNGSESGKVEVTPDITPKSVDKTENLKDLPIIIMLLITAFVIELAITFIFGFDKQSLIIVSIISAIGCAFMGALMCIIAIIDGGSNVVIKILCVIAVVTLAFTKPLIYKYKCTRGDLGKKRVYTIGLLSNIISICFYLLSYSALEFMMII